MKDTLKSSVQQMPLLQSFPTLELRSPYHLADLQPFSLELMSYTRHIRALALAFFIVGLLAVSSSLSFEAWQANPATATENGLLELAQGGFLLLAALLQAWRALSTHESGLQRDIRVGLALFAFALFLREVDIDKLGTSAIWHALEKILRVIALLSILCFTWHLARRIRVILRHRSKVLYAPTVMLTLLACGFYASGWPFDRELFSVHQSLSQWFEETLELNACLLFFCASLLGSSKTDVVKIPAPSF